MMENYSHFTGLFHLIQLASRFLPEKIPLGGVVGNILTCHDVNLG